MKGKIKARLIHMLGGYTREEYERDTCFRPEPEIMAQRLHTATCHTQVLIKKEEWDKGGDPATLETVKAFTTEKLAYEIAQYAEFSGPYIHNPEFYGFAMKIKVVKPTEGECLSE